MASIPNNPHPAAEPRPEQWMRRYLSELQRNPSPIYSVGLEAEDPYMWAATITGPPENPYEGVHFWTPNFHPNVSDRDNIFHSMLMSDTWCIATSVAQMLMTLAQMLLHPLVGEGDVVREEVAVMYRKDRARYKELARIFTRIRAG
ncbi:hypothetical protein EUTSA_v10002264mg [Eutrema salsugineum]|uniref:UBC core domain-containing protein n=1 Tax=Eutrema salsugineum TaxID=72664 RepID=V4MC82_EUTSA|nr:hypothetical protein EUTSA_v10002264mg [Eutrema salsugineum]